MYKIYDVPWYKSHTNMIYSSQKSESLSLNLLFYWALYITKEILYFMYVIKVKFIFLMKDVKKRLIFTHKYIKGITFFIDFDFLNTIMLIKSSESIGNILKIEHKHDIFEQISIFLFTFQDGSYRSRTFY